MNPQLAAATLAQRFRHGANWIQCAAQDVTRAIDSIGTQSMVPAEDAQTADSLTLIHQTLTGLETFLRARSETYLKQAKENGHADGTGNAGGDRGAAGGEGRGGGDDQRGQAP